MSLLNMTILEKPFMDKEHGSLVNYIFLSFTDNVHAYKFLTFKLPRGFPGQGSG